MPRFTLMDDNSEKLRGLRAPGFEKLQWFVISAYLSKRVGL